MSAAAPPGPRFVPATRESAIAFAAFALQPYAASCPQLPQGVALPNLPSPVPSDRLPHSLAAMAHTSVMSAAPPSDVDQAAGLPPPLRLTYIYLRYTALHMPWQLHSDYPAVIASVATRTPLPHPQWAPQAVHQWFSYLAMPEHAISRVDQQGLYGEKLLMMHLHQVRDYLALDDESAERLHKWIHTARICILLGGPEYISQLIHFFSQVPPMHQ
jgi:hypothetical protein